MLHILLWFDNQSKLFLSLLRSSMLLTKALAVPVHAWCDLCSADWSAECISCICLAMCRLWCTICC